MRIKLLSILLTSAVSTITFADGVATQQTPARPDNSFYQSTINQLNQSPDDDKKNDLNVDWVKYFSINGSAYVDAKGGDQSHDTQGENSQRLSVSNANLSIQGTPNTWSKFTLVANYSNASDSYVSDPSNDTFNDPDQQSNTVFVDQAYATFGDESRYPFFAQIGTQYLPFGQYNINPMVKSLGQILSETNATDVQVGFVVPEGLYGSAYIFQNTVASDATSSDTKPYNGGAVLGFKKSDEGILTDVGIGYMNNMSGVDAVGNYMSSNDLGYGSNVSALAPYASFQTGPFGISVDYVTALSRFDSTALPDAIDAADGAKPSALDTQASYAFNRYDMSHVLFVGYQVSGDASALNLPKKRYLAGYNVYPLKNVVLGFEMTRDTNYELGSVGDTADGEDYYTYNARVGIEF